MAAHSTILAWRIPWTEEPEGIQSMGSQGVGHNWTTKHIVFSCGSWGLLAKSCLILVIPWTLAHQAPLVRILEWVAISIFRGSSDPRIKPMSPLLQVDPLPLSHWGGLFVLYPE